MKAYNVVMGKIRAIEETVYGLYVWQTPDGRVVVDEDMNCLNIPSIKGDQSKIKALADAVKSFGITEGTAVFLAGRRRVTDEEYEEQRLRAKFGLTPDPYDVAATKEELRYKREFGS